MNHLKITENRANFDHIIDKPASKNQKSGIKVESGRWSGIRHFFGMSIRLDNNILLNKRSAVKYLKRHTDELDQVKDKIEEGSPKRINIKGRLTTTKIQILLKALNGFLPLLQPVRHSPLHGQTSPSDHLPLPNNTHTNQNPLELPHVEPSTLPTENETAPAVEEHPTASPSPAFNRANDKTLTEERIKELAAPTQDTMGNTGLTSLLAFHAFCYQQNLPPTDDNVLLVQRTLLRPLVSKMVTRKLNNLLRALTLKALAGNDTAKKALKTPNQENFDARNTPLILLVKMGNIEGGKAILPALELADLQMTTPRNNTALHIALTSLQFEMAFSLMNRAERLGGLDQIVNGQKNIVDLTPAQIIQKLLSKVQARDEFTFFDLMPLIEDTSHEEGHKMRAKIEKASQSCILYDIKRAIVKMSNEGSEGVRSGITEEQVSQFLQEEELRSGAKIPEQDLLMRLYNFIYHPETVNNEKETSSPTPQEPPIKPLIAVEEIVTDGNFEAKFLSVEEAASVLLAEDAYLTNFSVSDIEKRLKKTGGSLEEFKTFYRNQILEWTDHEKEQITHTLSNIQKLFSAYKIAMPKDLQFIKTTGREELGGTQAYCRKNTIVYCKGLISQTLLIHELFHIHSQVDPESRSELYKIIGFHSCKPFQLPSPYAERRIVNPDSPLLNGYVEVTPRGMDKTVKAIPFDIYDKDRNDGPQGCGGSCFIGADVYHQFIAVEVDDSGNATYLKDENNNPIIFDLNKCSGFKEKIGRNTGYIDSPEEIIAENFPIMILGSSCPTPSLIEKMKEHFTRKPA